MKREPKKPLKVVAAGVVGANLRVGIDIADETLYIVSMDFLNSTDFTKVSQYDFFHELSVDTLKNVFAFASVKELKHRELLYRAGDTVANFVVVIEGAMKLIRHSPKGDDVIVHFAIRGDIVGALLLNQGSSTVFPISVKSMGSSRLVCIPRATYKAHWQTNVHLQNKMNQVLYRRMRNIQDDKTLITSPLRIRIANLLLRHVDQKVTDVDKPLSLLLTRQEIADSLGVAVESVIRNIRVLFEDGTIYREVDKGPELINIEKLLKYIEP